MMYKLQRNKKTFENVNVKSKNLTLRYNLSSFIIQTEYVQDSL